MSLIAEFSTVVAFIFLCIAITACGSNTVIAPVKMDIPTENEVLNNWIECNKKNGIFFGKLGKSDSKEKKIER